METFRSDLRQIVSSYARPISILLQFQFPARHYRCSQSHGVEDHEKSYSVPLVGRNQFHPNSSLLFATVIGFRSAAISAPFSPSTTNRPHSRQYSATFSNTLLSIERRQNSEHNLILGSVVLHTTANPGESRSRARLKLHYLKYYFK